MLHNVGNVLNSVNVGIELLREKARGSKVVGISRDMTQANDHPGDPASFVANDPKRRKMFDYLTRLGEILAEEQKQTVVDLDNVQKSAHQAFDEVDQDEKILRIRLHATKDRLCFEFKDNGPGIEAENLPRIFNHGFTTKESGHGFGLHSSATSAMEMRGSLSAQSRGPGCGAVFSLEAPRVLDPQGHDPQGDREDA